MPKTGFPTPEEAEQAFYDAFVNADLSAMMAVWADREFIECIHPMGDRNQGRSAVAESWRQIFDGGLRVELELSDVHRTQDALLAVHIVYEHLSIPGRNAKYPPVIATNIYQLIEDGWYLVLHHASPSPGDDGEDEEEIVAKEGPSQHLH
ncbi:YybH family protein [Thiogranum longum]